MSKQTFIIITKEKTFGGINLFIKVLNLFRLSTGEYMGRDINMLADKDFATQFESSDSASKWMTERLYNAEKHFEIIPYNGIYS